MNDIIVFAVGLFVSSLVVYGIFSRVLHEMHEAKEAGSPPNDVSG